MAINAVHLACGRREREAPMADDRHDRLVAVAVVDGAIACEQ
ncbi:hypothetical protein Q9R08_14860 [Microbacterium sp. QXD-8]|uniref:Uncharacterized protein n=1 Tax=Microbacterium psychrotolerans TaxID=3068321 RepID=A0ABU0Z3V0_9MICO|nr:hypothetical protein [Microbacterium sp. QXD-8]MDQ7879268.1 hypothetical protein [Microbacterium sp. QXD-8]